MNPEYLSGEASASPAVELLLAGARTLADAGFKRGALAARNGPRTTTHAAVELDALRDQDFIEIADYDPKLDRLLMIGKREPNAHAPMMSLMMRAKKEIGALLIIDASSAPTILGGLPRAEPAGRPLPDAMAALEALRGTDAAAFGTHIIVTGISVPRAFQRARSLLEGTG